jgi:RNA polymerase-binding transcription factor DksA
LTSFHYSCYNEPTQGHHESVYSPAMPPVAGVSRSGGTLMDAYDRASAAEQLQRDEALLRLRAIATAQELHAEARAAQGLRGICEDCGAEIDATRLREHPTATVCRKCARGEDE